MGRNFKPSSTTSSPQPERLREARLARGYTVTEFSKLIGVSKQAISQYELGRSIPSGEVFMKIVNILKFPTSFFFEKDEVQSPRGQILFRSPKSTAQKARDALYIRMDWLERIYKYLDRYINFPNLNLPDLGEIDLEKLEPEDVENIAIELRKFWGLGNGPIDNIKLLLEKNGVIVSQYFIEDDKTDGLSQWIGDRPFILSAKGKASGRTRLSDMHEAGHCLLHSWVESEDLYNKDLMDGVEKQSHRIASAFLLPKESFADEVLSTSLDHFIELKKRWNVSIAAMIYRCEDLEILSEYQLLYLRKQLSKRRMRKKEPFDDIIKPENPSLLAKAVRMLIGNVVKHPEDIVKELKLPQDEIEMLCGLNPGELSPPGESKVIELNLKR